LRNADRLLSLTDEDEARLALQRGGSACEAARVDVQFKENGYLFLASPQGRPVLESNHQLQSKLGSDIRFLGSPSDIKAQFPYLHTDVRPRVCVRVCMCVHVRVLGVRDTEQGEVSFSLSSSSGSVGGLLWGER
jgi:hypothetical protein